MLLEAADVQASSPDALGMGWQQGSSAGFRDTGKLVLSAVLKKNLRCCKRHLIIVKKTGKEFFLVLKLADGSQSHGSSSSSMIGVIIDTIK